MKGKIILIEGTDGSGKETQSNKLFVKLGDLKHRDVFGGSMGFPRYMTPTGRIVGQCYLGKNNLGEGDVAWFGDPDTVDPKVASLYYAADRLNAKKDLLERLEGDGRAIIIDRYIESNMAHQGGKILDRKEREEFWDFLENLEYGLLELPRPDLTLFLYMPLEVSRELKKNQVGDDLDGHESNVGHMQRAENAYLELSERFGWTKINCAPDGTMKSLRSIEDIHEEIYEKVMKELY